MSLQGSLDTFALPDVLVLLASTKKSGELHVAGTRNAGTRGGGTLRANDLQGLLWVDAGQLVGFEVARATEAAEAVFELLRLDAGSFSFMGGTAAPSAGPPVEIEPVLAEAQSRLAEWREIEQVVPSLTCWLDLAPEPPAAHVSMRAEQWRLIVAVGGGCNVDAIVEHVGGSELAGCRSVKELIEAGLVRLAESAPAGASGSSASTGPTLSLVGSPEADDGFTAVHAGGRPAFDREFTSFGAQGDDAGWLSPRADEPVAESDAGDAISRAVAAAAAEAVASVAHGGTDGHDSRDGADGSADHDGQDAAPSGLPAGQSLEDFDSLVTLPPRARKSRAGANDAAKEAAAASAKVAKGFVEKRTLGAFLDDKANRDNPGSFSEAQALTRQLASLDDEPSDAGHRDEGEAAEPGETSVLGTAGERGGDAGEGERGAVAESAESGAEGAEDEPLNRGLLLKFLSSVRN